jgi:hypothetical protein
MRLAAAICPLLVSVAAGCQDPGEASFGDVLTDPELPARGHEDVHSWIEAGFYLGWSCEPEPHPARPGSGHGPNRICTNAALGAAEDGEGPYPVGSAAVKEVFDGDGNIRLFAVYRKVEDADGGDSWYWYEGLPGNVIANGMGDSTCTGCHARAPRDFVYTVVR